MKFLIFILLLGCGSAKGFQKNELSVTGFENYVKLFEEYSCTFGTKCIKVDNLIIKFGDLNDNEDGRATLFSDNRTPIITIDSEYWKDHDKDKREALLLHEMGHAILMRRHVAYEDDCPSSIMNPATPSGYCYIKYKEYYLKELFQ